jgi:hypothetical protein
MKIYAEDLTTIKVNGYPLIEFMPDSVKRITNDDYLLFYYYFNDKTFKLDKVEKVGLRKYITQEAYRNRPSVSIGTGLSMPMSVGYFKPPFDSKNVLFYCFLKYCLQLNSTNPDKDLKDLMAYFMQNDLKEGQDSSTTQETHTFDVYSRSQFETALQKYLFKKQIIINDILQVTDFFDNYFKANKNKSYYGQTLYRVVDALINPNGGLITDEGGKMDYLYVGINSSLFQADSDMGVKLKEAKKLFRSGQSPSNIFNKTGWLFNRYDEKWRFKIADKSVQLAKTDGLWLPQGSQFINRMENAIISHMLSNKSSSFLPQYIEEGWECTLGMILNHPELYKHYPQLYKLPVFYATTSSSDYSFYYTPDGNYINLVGNPEQHNLLTVLLHEIQHAIQRIEGYGTGGNLWLAGMIQGLGGANFRDFMFTLNQINKLYKEKTLSDYSFDKFVKLMDMDTQLKTIFPNKAYTDNDYYLTNYRIVVRQLLNYWLQVQIPAQVMIYIGREMNELFLKVKKYSEEGARYVGKLSGQGFSQTDINTIVFNSYEMLSGELEARDVQISYGMTEEEMRYLAPYSGESYDEKEVTVIIDETINDIVLPTGAIKGGCERTADDKFILHLISTRRAEPILHEIAHTLFYTLGDNISEQIIKKVPEQTLKEIGGVKEVFVEFFLCYLVRKNISITLTEELEPTRKLMDWQYFDNYFDDVFNAVPIKTIVDTSKYIEYLNRLNELVNG